jgi:hypothetical protein
MLKARGGQGNKPSLSLAVCSVSGSDIIDLVEEKFIIDP